MMKNKRGFELSLNMIIMVILALVFLGVAIAFILNMVPEVPTPPSTCDIYPPNSRSPVCINNQYEISRSQTINMKVAFFNDEDADIAATVQPMITCGKNTDGTNLSFTANSIGKKLPVGEASDYVIVLSVPKDAVRGTYPCNLELSSTQKSFAIVVK
jgi:hypothetical protein